MRSSTQPVPREVLQADALLVSSQSVLRRRRERAAYAINEIRLANRTKRAVLLLAAGFVVIAVVAQFQIRSVRTAQPQARPRLSNLRPDVQFDRLTINYVVRHGESLWIITERFYGTPSFQNIQKVRDANPSLNEDDRKLSVGTKLKLPIP